MTNHRGWITIAVVLFAALAAATFAGAQDKAGDSETVAVVNGKAISRTLYERELTRIESRMMQMGRPVDPAQLEQLKSDVLDALISRELLYQESLKQGIKTDEAAVAEQMEAIKSRFPDEAQFQATIQQMNLTEEGIKDEMARDSAIRQLVDKEVAGKVTVSDEETKAFYDSHQEMFKQPERVRASHILVTVAKDASQADREAAMEQIKDIQKRVNAGEDFAELAKAHSQCPSAQKGGDLGFFRRGQMVKPFEEAAFALKPGEVSDIVETQFGYHLIKVTEREEASTASYDEVKERLANHLKQEEVKKQAGEYVETLKAKAKIERTPPEKL